MNKKQILFWLSILISSSLLYFQAHFIPRENSLPLLLSFAALFGFFGLQFYSGKQLHFVNWVLAAIILRLSLLDSTPWLSDDYFRFVWDGILQNKGINPFAALPSKIITQVDFEAKEQLLTQMNSPNYYSVYPPICQWVFFLSAKFSFGSISLQIILLKLSMLLFELGSIFFILKILKLLKKPLYWSMLYLLHPLVVAELCGNIHFEAGMIFFNLATFYFLLKNKNLLVGLFLGLGIATKLWPLLFLAPLFLSDKKRAVLISSTAVGIGFISFLPFYFSGMIENFSQSLQLYFNHFEFHAGLFHWAKSGLDFMLGYEMRIEIMPFYKLIPIAFMGLFLWKFRSRKESRNWLFLSLALLSIYLLSGSVIHPWYILPLILLSVFYRVKFPMLWSVLIPLTYLTYRTTPYSEIFWINNLIHLSILAVIIFEINQKRLNSASRNLN